MQLNVDAQKDVTTKLNRYRTSDLHLYTISNYHIKIISTLSLHS